MKTFIRYIFVIFISLIIFNSIDLEAQKNKKPDYAGSVTFTQGNFGTYNYPVKDDSVVVFLNDSTGISFTIFSKTDKKNPRTLDLDCDKLQLVNRQEYGNIVAIDKTIPTGNYDMKLVFSIKEYYVQYTVYLSHYGDGTWAELTIFGEYDKVRNCQVTVIGLTKLK